MTTGIRRLSVFTLTALVLIACSGGRETAQKEGQEKQKFPGLQGPWLGQPPPGAEPQLFAPGIVSTALSERDVAATPDGEEIFFGRYLGQYAVSTIMYTKIVDGRWTEPAVAPFAADHRYLNLEPAMAPDGGRLMFLSTRPAKEGAEPNQDIWAVDRTADGWGGSYRLGEPVNTEAAEYFPSLTRDGTIYFTRQAAGGPSLIMRCRMKGGAWAEAEKLPRQVNCGAGQFNAFIDPDERYIIVCVAGRSDSLGGDDYYIVFHNEEDRWSEPVNMGAKVNTPGRNQFSPYVTPDGRYFFFMSSRLGIDEERFALTADSLMRLGAGPGNGNSDIYWVDASFIDALRPAGF